MRWCPGEPTPRADTPASIARACRVAYLRHAACRHSRRGRQDTQRPLRVALAPAGCAVRHGRRLGATSAARAGTRRCSMLPQHTSTVPGCFTACFTATARVIGARRCLALLASRTSSTPRRVCTCVMLRLLRLSAATVASRVRIFSWPCAAPAPPLCHGRPCPTQPAPRLCRPDALPMDARPGPRPDGRPGRGRRLASRRPLDLRSCASAAPPPLALCGGALLGAGAPASTLRRRIGTRGVMVVARTQSRRRRGGGAGRMLRLKMFFASAASPVTARGGQDPALHDAAAGAQRGAAAAGGPHSLPRRRVPRPHPHHDRSRPPAHMIGHVPQPVMIGYVPQPIMMIWGRGPPPTAARAAAPPGAVARLPPVSPSPRGPRAGRRWSAARAGGVLRIRSLVSACCGWFGVLEIETR